jgi:pimeloyl-ACP methyl ester carboxylesterase
VPRVRANGVGLHYELRGTGDPIVLLHGFTTSLVGNWERQGWLELLAREGFCAVALDFPSHGRSQRVYEPRACTTATLAGYVVSLLDRLEIERADLFGFSMGGGVALHLAMHHAERVRRVVVGGVGDAAVNALHDPRRIAGIAAAFESDSVTDRASPLGRRLRRNAELAGNDLDALLPFLRCGGWPGGLEHLRPVAAPVLLIVAEQDQYMAGVDEILRWLPDVEVVRAAGRDHHGVLADPTVHARVLDFVGD